MCTVYLALIYDGDPTLVEIIWTNIPEWWMVFGFNLNNFKTITAKERPFICLCNLMWDSRLLLFFVLRGLHIIFCAKQRRSMLLGASVTIC